MSWITPIFDRTDEDVAIAKATLAEWKTRNESDTRPLKGALNYQDLNRIEGNTLYLATELLAHGHHIDITVNVGWVQEDIPTKEDIDRIIHNADILGTAVHLTIEPPTTMIGYEQVNIIEKILYEVDKVIERLGMTYRYSGAMYSADWS